MKKVLRQLTIPALAILISLFTMSCNEDDMMLIAGTLPAELEISLQRLGRPYITDGGGGAYHPRQLVIQLAPGLSVIEREDFLFNVLLIESYVPCMCGDIIILATFDQETLDQLGGLEGAKISGESEDEIEEISFNYYNEMELIALAPSTVNTANFNAAILTADVVIGMVDAGIDFTGTSNPMFGRMHSTDEDDHDSGMDEDNNCLTDDYIGWDFVNEDNDATDDHSHGTHVTNLINDQIAAYNAVFDVNYRERSSFLPVKTHDLNGISTLFNVACGIIYAADHGADVINASWGFYSLNDAKILDIAIQYAFNTNETIFVASMGNEGSDLTTAKHYPTEFDYPYIFKVGAYDEQTGTLPDFTNYYPQPVVNLMAPGVDIESVMPEWSANAMAEKSGTSISAPFITAAVAYTILKCGNNDPAFIAAELASNFPEQIDMINGTEINVREFKSTGLSVCP